MRFIKYILSSPNDMYNVSSSCGVKDFFSLGVWQQTILMPSKTQLTNSLLQRSLWPTIL